MLDRTGQGDEAVIVLGHPHKMVVQQGMCQGITCGPDFVTDVYLSDGRLSASQFVLQGLVAGACKLWSDTGGGL